PDGSNVEQDTYEMTRLYAAGRQRFANVRADTLSPAVREEYELYRSAAAEFEEERADKAALLNQIENIARLVERSTALLRTELGGQELTMEGVRAIRSPRAEVQQAQNIYLQMAQQGITEEAIQTDLEILRGMVEYNLNPEFDPRPIVGDDPSNLEERVYGNNDVEGPAADHGTHVAGIIAA